MSRPRRVSAFETLTPALRYALQHGRGGLGMRGLAGTVEAFRLLHPSRRDELRAVWLSVRDDFMRSERGDGAALPWAAVEFGDKE